MNRIHQLKNDVEMREITDQIDTIEENKDDPTRMFAAVRILQNHSRKDPLLLDKKDGGKTSNDEDHAEIITEYFRGLFEVITAEPFPDIPPMPMKQKFTPAEIKKAIKKLKNNKAAGIDDLQAEQLKYGPNIIACEIADILNECASTGKHPKEIKLGVLCAIQKPGKPLGPCKSQRPIVLLSMLRKILAIIMLDRVGDKIRRKIPPSQAAYGKGRSTTEHVMAVKLLAEKAITSADYEIFILMKDMSRAFDTVNRKTLMTDLQSVLDPDELHIAKLLLKDVSLTVRCGSVYGEQFKTTIGTPQGDCLSPILFILYLANALRDNHSLPDLNEHSYSKTSHKNPTKNQTDQTFTNIDMQYADDINNITQNYDKILELKKSIPPKLERRELITNPTKDEEFKISRSPYNPAECVNCEECKRCMKCNRCKECPYCKSWKSCKILGSLIDTDTDIKRRKGLALDAIRKLDHYWKNNRTSIKTKLRIFNALIGSIFLYNSYLWAMNSSREGAIDAFQRRLLRHAINIKWPRKISNEALQDLTKQTPWSQTIAQRRLTWFGHMMRLPENTPVKIALKEAEVPVKLPRGRPKTTWMSCMKTQLKDDLGMDWEEAKRTASDRDLWKLELRRIRPRS